jgi:hypothetical protein
MNKIIVARIKALLNRARYAGDTRQWDIRRAAIRAIRSLYNLRHCDNATAIRRLMA